MYDAADLDSAPKVRIAMMAAALARRAPLEQIAGGRRERMAASFRWLVGGGWRRVGAVYVESSTSTASPVDLAFFGLMRALGRPVGVYFRDAYQLHRDLFPTVRARQRLADLVWRFTHPMLKRVASERFAPSAGLARILGLKAAILLPPGTDPSLPFLGPGSEPLIAAIVSPSKTTGFDLLRSAVEQVRETRPAVRLRIISRVVPSAPIPVWMELMSGSRPSLPQLLEPASVCVIPLPLTRYTHLAVPVRLTDYLSLGKPIVSTDSDETRGYLGASGAALLSADTPADLAQAIGRVLDDGALADRLARRARAFAEAPENTWDARARTTLRTLGLVAEG
jgi:glycosyltransferase involved in cell wall biosynthesis